MYSQLDLLKKKLEYINRDIRNIDYFLENSENDIFSKEERNARVKRLNELEEEKDNIVKQIGVLKK